MQYQAAAPLHFVLASAAEPLQLHVVILFCEPAVRTAKFVARKQWVVAGADDMYIRVYNHNTMEKVKQFEAHTDYIRWAAARARRRSLQPLWQTLQMQSLVL